MLSQGTDRARIDQLKDLLEILADEIDQRPGARDLAGLAKQYRETLREIEELEGGTDDGDEIASILAGRAADGKPGAVRKDRSGVS